MLIYYDLAGGQLQAWKRPSWARRQRPPLKHYALLHQNPEGLQKVVFFLHLPNLANFEVFVDL